MTMNLRFALYSTIMCIEMILTIMCVLFIGTYVVNISDAVLLIFGIIFLCLTFYHSHLANKYENQVSDLPILVIVGTWEEFNTFLHSKGERHKHDFRYRRHISYKDKLAFRDILFEGNYFLNPILSIYTKNKLKKYTVRKW